MSPTMTADRTEPIKETPMTTPLDTSTAFDTTTTDITPTQTNTASDDHAPTGRVSKWNVIRGE